MFNTVETPATKLELHFTVVAEGEMFTAICDEIPGLITCAPTVERLMIPMLRDAIIGWFDTLKKRGRLDEQLAYLGVDPKVNDLNFVPILKGDAAPIQYPLRDAS